MKILCKLGKQMFGGTKLPCYKVQITDAKGTHTTVLAEQFIDADTLDAFEARLRETAAAHSKTKGKTNVGNPCPKGGGK